MAKEIHILLTEEQWNKLHKIRMKADKEMSVLMNGKDSLEPKTYEEYLEQEKKHPTMALFC